MVAEFATDLIENRLWLGEQKPGGLSTPGNGRGAPKLGQRAVVIGAGIGGLSAAGALAKYFERVDIIERDRPCRIRRIAVRHASGSAPAWPARRRPSRARPDFPRFQE